MNKIYNTPMAFVENSLSDAIRSHREFKNRAEGSVQKGSPVTETPDCDLQMRSIYFAGATLCIDVADGSSDKNTMTMCWADETIGYFSGGSRRLVSIKALKLMRELMLLCDIQHEPKPTLC